MKPPHQGIHMQKAIATKQREFLFGPNDHCESLFYLLPKRHKDPSSWTVPNAVPPGRPIVSDCNSTIFNVSLYIDSFLGLLSTRHQSYLKDTYHFLNIISLLKLPSDTCLFTLDVDSLYTNIDMDAGLQTVRYPDRSRPDSEIFKVPEICQNLMILCSMINITSSNRSRAQRWVTDMCRLTQTST